MSEHASTSTRQAIEWRFDPISGEPLSAHLVPTPLPTTPEPLGYIPTDAIDQIKTPPRLITHKVPVLSYAAEGYTAIYTQPAPGVPQGEPTINWFGTHFTYKNQPCDNVTAWRFGEAARSAKPGGDLIDHGLSLLHELEARGYGIFALAAAQAKGADHG